MGTDINIGRGESAFSEDLTQRTHVRGYRPWAVSLKQAPLRRDDSIGHEQLWPVIVHVIHE